VRTSRNDNHGTPSSTLVEYGRAFYENHLKAALEPSHSGEFVAIEPSTGRYFFWRDRYIRACFCNQQNAEWPILPHARR
jgi:hypothetical protein